MLRLYNTLSRKKEDFVPLKDGRAGLYTCGPTVYNYAHIGNFRTYIFEDVLRRYLKYRGFDVFQVMNITDIEDKIIRDSQAAGVTIAEFTSAYTDSFFEDLDSLNIERAEEYPRATDCVEDMVRIIEKLLERGHAYRSEGGIYFRISSFPEYGQLSERFGRVAIKQVDRVFDRCFHRLMTILRSSAAGGRQEKFEASLDVSQ